MTHPGHNNPWHAANDWGYKVKFDTDRQLHETRQRMAALDRECASRNAALSSSRSSGSNLSSSFDYSSGYSGGSGRSDASGLAGFIVLAFFGIMILNEFVPLAEYFWRAVNLMLFVGAIVIVYAAVKWVRRLLR